MKDATRLKLAINRNRNELMCNAYNNAGDTWLINPMFIAPRGRLARGYPCSTTACRAADGAGVPCFDEDGNLIRDQEDTVFGPQASRRMRTWAAGRGPPPRCRGASRRHP